MPALPTQPESVQHRQPGPFRVAVTGHWNLGDVTTEVFVHQSFVALLNLLAHEHPEGLVALSGLALGADTIFAEAALALGITLEACIANSAVIEKYAPGSEREQHFRLRARSQRVHELPFVERTADSYLALGRWLVDSSDLLIAAWDGRAPAKPGGTGDVVAMALMAGRPVLHVHTIQRTITMIQETG